jgi:mycothiol synthase
MLEIRYFTKQDLPSLVDLINAADAVDKQERATTLAETEHEMSFPTYLPETDCFLAWEDDVLVGYADLYVAKGTEETGSKIYSWGEVHPQWRRRGIGRLLVEICYFRAEEHLPEIQWGPVYFHGRGNQVEDSRRALFEGFGMQPVRYFVNLTRPLNGNLPPVDLPSGVRIRAFDPMQDMETLWRVHNQAFKDNWGHTPSRLEEYQHFTTSPHFRRELWFLAELEDTGEVIGLGLGMIDPDWIAQTGRQEGYVEALAVLREHRAKGIGTALLSHSLHALRENRMEWAYLHADSENLTGAMRLYERVGFTLRKTSVSYRKLMSDRGVMPAHDNQED